MEHWIHFLSSTVQNDKDAKELKVAKNMPMFSSVEAIYSKMLTLFNGELFLENRIEYCLFGS